MHSQVKSVLTEPLYLLTLRLFDICISNNTHRLLVVSTTSTRAVKVRPKWGINRQNFERCVHIERPLFWKYVKKIETFIQIIALFYGEKLSEVEESPSQPSQLYRASVQQKKLPRLTELTAGRLSPEFTQTLIIYIQTFNNRLHHSRRATQLCQFEPDSDFGSIFFLNYNARACSVNLHLAKAGWASQSVYRHGKKFSQVEGWPYLRKRVARLGGWLF